MGWLVEGVLNLQLYIKYLSCKGVWVVKLFIRVVRCCITYVIAAYVVSALYLILSCVFILYT